MALTLPTQKIVPQASLTRHLTRVKHITGARSNTASDSRWEPGSTEPNTLRRREAHGLALMIRGLHGVQSTTYPGLRILLQ